MKFTQVPSLQVPLSRQVRGLSSDLDQIRPVGILGVLLIGSCARGTATYRSDVDLLVILDQRAFKAHDVRAVQELLENQLQAHNDPLPLQFVVVGKSVFQTQEPAMMGNLRDSLILYDPQRLLQSRLKALKGKTDDESDIG
ncbi:MAG: nucleotidyltransferase domain-containing protein [Bdellovibrionales bacterium]